MSEKRVARVLPLVVKGTIDLCDEHHHIIIMKSPLQASILTYKVG